MQKILVAIENEAGAGVVIDKALAIATHTGAAVRVVQVVYEGFVDLSAHDVETSDEMKTLVMQAEESRLEDLIDPFRGKVQSLESATLWHKDRWHGILDAAEDFGADLIIKAVTTSGGLGARFRPPEDWNLFRHSTIPVMAVKDEAWVDNPVVIAAVDVLNESQAELTRKVIAEAGELTSALGGQLILVAVVPSLNRFAGPEPVAIDYDRIRREVGDECRKKMTDAAESAGVAASDLQVLEGNASMEIAGLAERKSAEMVVMGTVARSGLRGLVIGNTSESIIHETTCDVVVLRA